MSDHRDQFFDLAASEEQVAADAIGPRVTAEFERTHPGWQYDPLIPVTVVPGWNSFYASEGFEGIRCPRCGEVSENAMQLIGEWDETHRAHEADCERCGLQAMLADWDLRDAIAFAWVGVVADLPGCESALLQELQAALGGKWVHIHLHL